MTPQERLVAIVEEWRQHFDFHMSDQDKIEWQEARDLLARLLANEKIAVETGERCPRCTSLGRRESFGVWWCTSCGRNLTLAEAEKEAGAAR